MSSPFKEREKTDDSRFGGAILWVIIGLSLAIHVASLVVGHVWLNQWRWIHYPVHAAVEMSGALIAIWVAWMLLALQRREKGTSYNVWIAGALIGMGVLDGLHALVHAGPSFVWLHSTATLFGGLLFAMIWLPPTVEQRVESWWPWTVFIGVFLFGFISLAFPEIIPVMVKDQQFTPFAKALNIIGGLLLFIAAIRLVRTYFQTRNTDDLLFCLHCSLFGAAAVMFEQSQLWDLPWWGWHLLRLMAYGVALWFVVLSEIRFQRELALTAEGLKGLSQKLETRVEERTNQLSQAESRFQQVVEDLSVAIIMIDRQGRITLSNPLAESMFGYEPGELLGHAVEDLIPQSLRAGHVEMRDGYFDYPERRNMGLGRDLKGLRKDGSEIPVEIALSPLQADDELFVLAAISDISFRKDVEQQLRAFTDDLQKHGDELSAANLQLQQFAHAASHDLQEPLRIVTYSSELFQDYCENLSEDAANQLGIIMQQIERMRALVTSLQTYARLESRSRPFEMIDMQNVVDEVTEKMRSSIDEQQASIQFGNLPTILGDRLQIVQLVENLISNALIYHDGKIPEIHVSADQQEGEWHFSVRDNGIGVPPKFHDKIFEVFRRLHHQHRYPGNGIGLSICQRIVERHHGRIWVESKPDEGATFHFTLPIEIEKETER